MKQYGGFRVTKTAVRFMAAIKKFVTVAIVERSPAAVHTLEGLTK